MTAAPRARSAWEQMRHPASAHLVPDLPMHEVFLYLESLECSLLHHTLRETMHTH